MDAMTYELLKHKAKIEERQNLVKACQEKNVDSSLYEFLLTDIDQYQKEAAIMTQEIKSGKNLD